MELQKNKLDLISLCQAMFQILDGGLEENYMSTFLVIRKLLYLIFANIKKKSTRISFLSGFFRSLEVP